MRQHSENQGRLDLCPIASLELNFDCRDEIVPILRGLQHLYADRPLREKILHLVAADVNRKADPENGRPGMSYWQILVLSAIRHGCNLNFDKLQDLTENHRNLRILLQLSAFDPVVWSTWRSIAENLRWLKPETVEQISLAVVQAGHRVAGVPVPWMRMDSFVVSTNVHYPAESSLINDGLQYLLRQGRVLALGAGLPGWRQSVNLASKAGVLAGQIARVCSRKGPNYVERSRGMYVKLLSLGRRITVRAVALLEDLSQRTGARLVPALAEFAQFVEMTKQVCRTARQRVLQGQTVPNSEKLFSLYEQHTQLYKRGKAHQPVQFGRLTSVTEDALGFILDHYVYGRKENDADVLVPRVLIIQERFAGKIEKLSVDRGFYSPENERWLAGRIPLLCMPKRGWKQVARQRQECSVEFRLARRRHPGIESAIGALQAGNGLDRCRDRSEVGFKRYIAYGILARNLQVLGKLLIAQEAPMSAAAYSDRRHRPAA